MTFDLANACMELECHKCNFYIFDIYWPCFGTFSSPVCQLKILIMVRNIIQKDPTSQIFTIKYSVTEENPGRINAKTVFFLSKCLKYTHQVKQSSIEQKEWINNPISHTGNRLGVKYNS